MGRVSLGGLVRVGVDLGQTYIQVHAVDAEDQVAVVKQLRRADFAQWCSKLPAGCVVAMEAGSGSHHWGRALSAFGLQVRLVSPAVVTPYRLAGKAGKNDANDAEAICEAAGRPRMRFVPIKTPLQQSWLAIHVLRDGYIKERTALSSRIRGVLAEFGIVLPSSPGKLQDLLPDTVGDASRLPAAVLRTALRQTLAHLRQLERRVDWCDEQIKRHLKADVNAMRAKEVWGIGVLGASAVAATCGNLRQFSSGKQFGAWLGLVPRQRSSGGVQKFGRITRRGDPYLRKLMVMGARSALRVAAARDDAVSQWVSRLRTRVGWRKAAVALANKNGRILWATLSKEQEFRLLPESGTPGQCGESQPTRAQLRTVIESGNKRAGESVDELVEDCSTQKERGHGCQGALPGRMH